MHERINEQCGFPCLASMSVVHRVSESESEVEIAADLVVEDNRDQEVSFSLSAKGLDRIDLLLPSVVDTVRCSLCNYRP